MWLFLSDGICRLHGASLSVLTDTEIQLLFAKVMFSELGDGEESEIHSKLLKNLLCKWVAPKFPSVFDVNDDVISYFNATVKQITQATESWVVGFLVGLEVPALDEFNMVISSFMRMGVPEEALMKARYIEIHQAIELDHQEAGSEAMEKIKAAGFSMTEMREGGKAAIEFLLHMIGSKGNLLSPLQVA
ncbi:MAG: iron-containing redox enzyme family protein [Cyanobacteria bacterium CRU_2_1]|nr:iron-containing redox enzyme family protein [Cyanobacteria bacterium CRU_2_1]